MEGRGGRWGRERDESSLGISRLTPALIPSLPITCTHRQPRPDDALPESELTRPSATDDGRRTCQLENLHS